jgi:hypothetical protein
MLLDAKADAVLVQLPIGRVVIDAGDQRRLAAGCGARPLESRLKKRKLAGIRRESESGFEHDTSASVANMTFL